MQGPEVVSQISKDSTLVEDGLSLAAEFREHGREWKNVTQRASLKIS